MESQINGNNRFQKFTDLPHAVQNRFYKHHNLKLMEVNEKQGYEIENLKSKLEKAEKRTSSSTEYENAKLIDKIKRQSEDLTVMEALKNFVVSNSLSRSFIDFCKKEKINIQRI